MQEKFVSLCENYRKRCLHGLLLLQSPGHWEPCRYRTKHPTQPTTNTHPMRPFSLWLLWCFLECNWGADGACKCRATALRIRKTCQITLFSLNLQMQNQLDVSYRREGRAERRLGEQTLFLPSQGIQYPFQTNAACVITIFRNTQRGKYDRSLRGCKAERKPAGIRSFKSLVHVPQSISKVG